MTETFPRADLGPEQRYALTSLARNLGEQFARPVRARDYRAVPAQQLRRAVEATREVGIDISGELPNPWTDEVGQAADVVSRRAAGTPARIRRFGQYVDSATSVGMQQVLPRPVVPGPDRSPSSRRPGALPR